MRLIHIFDAYVRRCYLAWRFIVALHYSPRIAWNKARRPS